MTISEPPLDDSKPKNMKNDVIQEPTENNATITENNNVQKIVIDVKAEEPSAKETPPPAIKKKPKIADKKPVIAPPKREIALVVEPTPKKCHGFVGFANLPNQVYK